MTWEVQCPAPTFLPATPRTTGPEVNKATDLWKMTSPDNLTKKPPPAHYWQQLRVPNLVLCRDLPQCVWTYYPPIKY